jgi:hypothetical protein
VLVPRIGPLLDRLLPDAAGAFLDRVLRGTMPRGADGRWSISSAGRFSGRIAADLLAFARNHRMDAAMVLADADVSRVLYFEAGTVIAADSDVIFERLGRVLLRTGTVAEDVARAVIDLEQEVGIVAASGLVPPAALRPALERRAWEIGTNLPLMHNAHFAFVEGTPVLGGLPRLAIAPMDLAMEGLRRYDEWRNRPAESRGGALSASSPRPTAAPPAPPPPPARASATHLSMR